MRCNSAIAVEIDSEMMFSQSLRLQSDRYTPFTPIVIGGLTSPSDWSDGRDYKGTLDIEAYESYPKYIMIDISDFIRELAMLPHVNVYPDVAWFVNEALFMQDDIDGSKSCLYTTLDDMVEGELRDIFELNEDEPFSDYYSALHWEICEKCASAILALRVLFMENSVPMVEGNSIYELEEIIDGTLVLRKQSIESLYNILR